MIAPPPPNNLVEGGRDYVFAPQYLRSVLLKQSQKYYNFIRDPVLDGGFAPWTPISALIYYLPCYRRAPPDARDQFCPPQSRQASMPMSQMYFNVKQNASGTQSEQK